jgi:hypothetical protein
MKKLIISLTLIITLLFPTIIFAQNNDSNLSTTTNYFDIKLAREGQSGWNKAVTYKVYVTPKIDSKRTQIIWDAPTAITINPKHQEFVDMYQGQTYSFKATVQASRAGNYEISVNLIAWQHDTNYTNSVSDIITFNSDLLAVPIDPGYTYGVIAKYLVFAGVGALFIWGLIYFGKKGMKPLKEWLTPPTK